MVNIFSPFRNHLQVAVLAQALKQLSGPFRPMTVREHMNLHKPRGRANNSDLARALESMTEYVDIDHRRSYCRNSSYDFMIATFFRSQIWLT